MSGDDLNRLGDLLGLHDVGVQVTRAVVTGQGAQASAQLFLDNGECLEFDSIREMARPVVLRAELAACASAVPAKFDAKRALDAVAELRRVARHQRTITEDDLARDWGTSYLQIAREVDVDMNDQGSRWEAFCDLRSLDNAREEGTAATAVLLHTDGTRLVRSGHFYPWVRRRDPGQSEARIARRMQRVGWEKRSASGRIKATEPAFGRSLNWSFLVVPAGWDADGSGNEVTAGVGITRAREEAPASCVEGVTSRYPVTDGGAA